MKPRARLRTVRGLEAFTRLEPLELAYLAGSIPEEHPVRILDLRLHRYATRSLRRTLDRFRPDLVGVTGYSHEASSVKSIAQSIKHHDPATKVVVGGHHATAVPRDFDTPSIDAVVRGEGCGPFRRIVEALEKNRNASLEGIVGVLVHGLGPEAPAVDEWPDFPDPNDMPTPRRDLWDARAYRSVWTTERMKNWDPLFPPVSMVRASWGCRMKCSFCVVPLMYGGRHQTREADRVAAEIESAPARHIYFCDDENFIDEGFAWELAERLEARKVRKRYFAWTRSTTVLRSPELIKRWRSIGLDAAFLGFEFVRDADLRDTRKGSTVITNERALDTLRSLEVAVHAAFMIRPEWGEEEFQELEQYVRSLPPVQCSFTVCTPSPGTHSYAAMRPDIWVDNPYELHDCMHPLTATKLPLRRFSQRYASLAREGTARTPVRLQRPLTRPQDLFRVARAESKYYRGFKDLHRDYPSHLVERPCSVELDIEGVHDH